MQKENCLLQMYTKTITPVTLTRNKYLRLVEMQIFIFSMKELEVLLMRSEIVQPLLKCFLFSNLSTVYGKAQIEALCGDLIRTQNTMCADGHKTVYLWQSQKKLPYLSCLCVCECPEERMNNYFERGVHIKHSTANGLILQSSGKIWWVSGKGGKSEQMRKMPITDPFCYTEHGFEWYFLR